MNDVTLKSSAVYKNEIFCFLQLFLKLLFFLETRRFDLLYKLVAIYEVCIPISNLFCFYNDRMIQTYQ